MFGLQKKFIPSTSRVADHKQLHNFNDRLPST